MRTRRWHPRRRQAALADVTDGIRKAPARAMLRAVGMTDDDWEKPQVGIANSWNEITPCNMTLRTLAEHVKRGVREAGGFPMEFGTITVSDGISMGHEGMRASLVSREVISDSVETVVFAERLDGFVGLCGCDKSIPAMLMAAARLDLPSVLVYNGSIMPGEHAGLRSTSAACSRPSAPTSAGHDRRRRAAAEIEHACPGEGVRWHVHGQHDELDRRGAGHEHPRVGVAAGHRRSPARRRLCRRCRRRADAAELGITPRMIMTKAAFENAIALTSAPRRLDQRRAPPAGHRQRGQGRR